MIDYLIDVYFLFDMVLSFRTTYHNEDNELVLDVKLIRRRYLRSWFAIDLVAIIPFELLAYAGAGSADDLGVLGVTKLPRLLRLGRVLKKLDKFAGANLFRIVHLMTGLTLFAHWLGCIWWLIGARPPRQPAPPPRRRLLRPPTPPSLSPLTPPPSRAAGIQEYNSDSDDPAHDDDDRKEGGSPEWSARDRSRSGVFSMLSEERQRVLGPDRDEY